MNQKPIKLKKNVSKQQNGHPRPEFKTPLPPPARPLGPPPQTGVEWRLVIWAVLGTVALFLLLAYGQAIFFGQPQESAAEERPRFVIPLSPTPPPPATGTPTPATAEAIIFAAPTETPPPPPGGRVVVLRPASQGVGWLAAGEPGTLADHLGDSFIYAGTLNDQAHYGLVQFDLKSVPRGVTIEAASLRLIGLREDRLNPNGEGAWRLQWLDTEFDYRWADLDFHQLEQAETWTDFKPPLTQADLGAERVNQFDFTPEQLALLERRLQEGNDQFGKKITFRLAGPAGGADNLFVWDSGHGPASRNNAPELFLSLESDPLETPPPHYVVVTSTPTPEAIFTAVANSRRMTAEATREGTVTPLPPYWVTPVLVTATPTAENKATAQALDALATAAALTTGEPINLEVVTVTPTPTYVIITSTPTPEDIATAVAVSLRITAEANRVGTATPFPENWVTPAVVTSTPTPLNAATVEYFQAVALTTGTPTPLPGNAQTATPTAVSEVASLLASPTATATPTATPQPIPDSLQDKIIFLSDREGATEEERLRADKARATPQVVPQPYVYDPATGKLARLSARWPYDVASSLEPLSPDNRFETYNKALLWTNVEDSQGNRRATEEIVIHLYDHLYETEQIVTRMGAGIAYDPVLSPGSDDIAFVSTESGNDEIWIIKQDGNDPRQLTRNEWEWDKHPSWSPDGQQIVFFSNRTGQNQLWIMNKDGSDQRLLMASNPYNDWDPVWVKRLDPPPPLLRKPDWRFVKPPEESEPVR